MPEEPLLAGAVVKPGSKGRQERGWTLEGRDGFFQGWSWRTWWSMEGPSILFWPTLVRL